MRARLAVSLLVLGLVLAGTADAQRRRGLVDITPSGERHGFWLNLGFARGDEQYKFAGDPDWTEGPAKPTFSLRLGGTVNPNFRLGGEVIGWTNRTVVDGESATEYLAGLLLIGQFYPSRRAGLFVKGGAGFSRSGVSVYGPGDSSEDGFAWTVGAGYEIRLSRSLFLTPTVDLMQHRSDGSVIDGVREPALYERLVSVGVALTIQPGR